MFKSDSIFSYSCSCGNPINDSDLCESYVYNDVNKEIKLDCFETTLELDFNDEVRKFEKMSN